MAKAQPKLVLAPAKGIPFNQLVLSQSNVRRVKNGVSIEQLAADIERRGLLQSLSVRPVLDEQGNETGRFQVPAGGRRFGALEMLVRRKRLASDALVPCIVKPADAAISAEEDSYAENTHREALHPLDEFRGMKMLVEQGDGIEDVAARFHVTPAVVRQRLKLASVSPALHEVYAADGMSLEQLMAFTVCDDHARQEQVWELVQSHHNQSAHFIRARLNESTVPARDPRALFVGIDAYVAGGGCVLRDLFEEDRGGWLQDAALLDRLVLEKLGAEAERIGSQGWKWVEAVIDLPYGFAHGLRRIEPLHTPPTQEDLTEVESLHAQAQALEDEWANADEIPDTVDAQITALDERIAQLAGGSWSYDPAEMAIAGVFVTINRTGALEVEAGWVRTEDEPLVAPDPDMEGADDREREPVAAGQDCSADAGSAEADGAGARASAEGEATEEDEEGLKPLPDRLVCELTAERTLALQDALAGNPAIAFAAVLHNFVLACFYHGRTESCLTLSLNKVGFAVQPSGMQHSLAARAIEARHAMWKEQLPRSDKELWDALLLLDAGAQAELFAHCAAYSVNALFEVAPKYDNGRISAHMVERRLAHANVLARGVCLDLVAAGWTPTAENFFGKVTKARILEAVTEGRGAETAALIDHLKKPDMAREAERLMADAGWLPEPLRTPELPAQAELLEVSEGAALPAFLTVSGEGADSGGISLAIAAE
ncbi:ParB/RepB/Spo0J family partition protein [Sphingomonas sp. R647]|uniref:ParB/RepB/Spo0J family partition protein n=1 Tax=Sphingomonas sp. R647 TaxID=2875233 RepID=UPI001CD6EAA6|nr:ParB/RepB/Spo0J family partition protein [Sphingomonas sp. R647]MCA1200181.1 ParB/RepB/Spo0J family partition protein [Sphingomonas sp. R647]